MTKHECPCPTCVVRKAILADFNTRVSGMFTDIITQEKLSERSIVMAGMLVAGLVEQEAARWGKEIAPADKANLLADVVNHAVDLLDIGHLMPSKDAAPANDTVPPEVTALKTALEAAGFKVVVGNPFVTANPDKTKMN